MKAEKKLLRKILPASAGLAFTWLVLMIVFLPVFKSGLPGGNDTMGHLFKVWYLGEHLIDYHNFADWLPYWYNGTNLFKYYPPLFYFFSLPIYLIIREPIATYKVIAVLWFISMSSAMYWVVYRRFGLLPAIVSSLLFTLAPTTIRAFFWGGGLPQAFSYIFLPLSFDLTLRLAEEGKPKRDIVLLSLVFLMFILAHAMSAAFSMIVLLVFLIIYQIFNPHRRPLVVTKYLAAAILGIALSAFWLFPAYLGKVMPLAPAESVDITSVPFKELIGMTFRDGVTYARYIPLSLMLCSLIGFFRKRKPITYGLLGVAAFTSVFVMGTRTPLYKLVPMSASIFPEYTAFAAIFALAFLSGIAVSDLGKIPAKKMLAVAAAVIIVGLFFFDTLPAFGLIKNRPLPGDLTALLSSVEGDETPGRISYLGLFASELTYYPTVVTGRGLTEGFFFQGTDHFKELANFNYVIGKNMSPGYVHRKLSQWNTRFLFAKNVFLEKGKKVVPAEFEKINSNGDWNMFANRGEDRSYQRFTRDAIAIGDNASTVSIQFPWIMEGGRYVDDYDWKYLSRFKQIILVGFSFHNRAAAIDLLERAADNGAEVIVDLQGMEGEFGVESSSFLDVLPVPVSIKGSVPISVSASAPSELKAEQPLKLKDFSYQGDAWKTVGYTGLDASYLNFAYRGKTYSAMGYKKLGGSRIYFVGMNLFYHALTKKDATAKKILLTLLDKSAVNKSAEMPAFKVSRETIKDESLSFSYTVNKETAVVVSRTWNDNWRAAIDGKSFKAYDYENMPLFFLPAGSHTVELTYHTTSLEIFAKIVSVLAAVVAAYIAYITIRSSRHQDSASNSGI